MFQYSYIHFNLECGKLRQKVINILTPQRNVMLLLTNLRKKSYNLSPFVASVAGVDGYDLAYFVYIEALVFRQIGFHIGYKTYHYWEGKPHHVTSKSICDARGKSCCTIE